MYHNKLNLWFCIYVCCSYANTIYNLNWREKRAVPGYYGCGNCSLCRASIFGEKFKVQYTRHWYKITGYWVITNSIIDPLCWIPDTIDCDSTNVLFIATCKMCQNQIQYGSSAVDIKKEIENLKVMLSHFLNTPFSVNAHL